MARPPIQGLTYFPHDTDASSDEKIEALRSLYGNDGYAVYFILLERIYRSSDAILDLSNESTEIIVAKKTGLRIDKFRKIVINAVKFGLFDEKMWDSSKKLSSNGIKKRFDVVIKQRVYAKKKYAQNKGISRKETKQDIPQETVQDNTSKKPFDTYPVSLLKENKSKINKKENIKERIVLPEWIDKNIWDAFLEMRKKEKATPTDHAKVLIIQELGRLKTMNNNPNDVLNQSIRNNWKDVFPLRDNGHSKNGIENTIEIVPATKYRLVTKPVEEIK